MKPLIWIFAVLAAIFALVALTVPHGHPDVERARRDFHVEHPNYNVERIAKEEVEVISVCYRIFYRVPGDAALHEEFRQYLHSDGQWRISHRNQCR